MKLEYTNRGFGVMGFEDINGIKCSLQESSLATQAAIWLGCDDADPRHLDPDVGWQNITLPKQTVCNTRMHLSREQVEKLIPILQKFVDTGELE